MFACTPSIVPATVQQPLLRAHNLPRGTDWKTTQQLGVEITSALELLNVGLKRQVRVTLPRQPHGRCWSEPAVGSKAYREVPTLEVQAERRSLTSINTAPTWAFYG
jgi:hypothetical protein